jgi:hypothetical protein
MRKSHWLIAAAIILLLALALTSLFPGGDETMSESQPGPLPQSPAPAPQ